MATDLGGYFCPCYAIKMLKWASRKLAPVLNQGAIKTQSRLNYSLTRAHKQSLYLYLCV